VDDDRAHRLLGCQVLHYVAACPGVKHFTVTPAVWPQVMVKADESRLEKMAAQPPDRVWGVVDDQHPSVRNVLAQLLMHCRLAFGIVFKNQDEGLAGHHDIVAQNVLD
jgi:hypothetical protein